MAPATRGTGAGSNVPRATTCWSRASTPQHQHSVEPVHAKGPLGTASPRYTNRRGSPGTARTAWPLQRGVQAPSAVTTSAQPNRPCSRPPTATVAPGAGGEASTSAAGLASSPAGHTGSAGVTGHWHANAAGDHHHMHGGYARPGAGVGPRARDWALLVVSAGFTGAALAVLAVGDDAPAARSGAAFFGMCTVIASFFLREKWLAGRNAGVEGVVEAARGRIFESKVRLLGGGATLAAGGGVMLASGGFPWPFTLASAAIFLVGVGFLVAVAVGRLGAAWLEFEAGGLRVGDRRGSFLVPWDDVVGCEVWSLHDNAVVAIALRDPRAAVASAEPASHAPAVAATLGATSTLTLFPSRFALDAGLLARSVATYARVPAAREQLRRPLLG